MRVLSTLFLFVALTLGINAQNKFTLNNGKNVPVRIMTEIYSQKSDTYRTINAIVDADVRDDSGENILIRRGTPVEVSSQIKRARGVGRPAEVNLNFLTTKSVDGQVIRLIGDFNQRGKSKKGLSIGLSLGIGIGLICPPALFCFCIKGGKITVPANTVINNVLVNDVYKVTVD